MWFASGPGLAVYRCEVGFTEVKHGETRQSFMKFVYPVIGSMRRTVCLPTWMVDFYCKCRQIYHTWMLWVCFCLNTWNLKDFWCQRTIGRRLSRLPMSLYSVRWQPSDASFWHWSYLGRNMCENQLHLRIEIRFGIQQLDMRLFNLLSTFDI